MEVNNDFFHVHVKEPDGFEPIDPEFVNDIVQDILRSSHRNMDVNNFISQSKMKQLD